MALVVSVRFSLFSYSQNPNSSVAPTASQDPLVIDQTRQKASAKYDAPGTSLLNDADCIGHQGPPLPKRPNRAGKASLKGCSDTSQHFSPQGLAVRRTSLQ